MRFYDDLSESFSMGYMNDESRATIVLVTWTEGFWAVKIDVKYEKRTYQGDWHRASTAKIRDSNVFKYYVGVLILGQDNAASRRDPSIPVSPTLQVFPTELKAKNGEVEQLSVSAPPNEDQRVSNWKFSKALADEIWYMLQKDFPNSGMAFGWIPTPSLSATGNTV